MTVNKTTYKGTKLYVNKHSQEQHITAIFQTQDVNFNLVSEWLLFNANSAIFQR